MDKYVKKYMSIADAKAATDIVTPTTITIWEGDEHIQLSHCGGTWEIPCEIKGDTIDELSIVEKRTGYTGSTGELGEALHFIGAEDNTTLYCDFKDGRYMYYSTDGVNWKTYATRVSVLLNKGDVVWFKGCYRDPDSNYGAQFYSGRPVICAGEVNSMIYGDRAWTGLDIPRGSFWHLFDCCPIITAPIMSSKVYGEHACYYMFHSSSITCGPDLSHVTSVARQAFDHMFSDCSGLQYVSKLNASYVGDRACQYMFYNCGALTNVPTDMLPATSLVTQCYTFMFANCTNLLNSPDLPAPTLVDRCYRSMFNGCNNLNSIKCLATNISASSCLDTWVIYVGSNGTFTKDASMTSWPSGNSGIPTGWTVQDA